MKSTNGSTIESENVLTHAEVTDENGARNCLEGVVDAKGGKGAVNMYTRRKTQGAGSHRATTLYYFLFGTS